MRQTFRACAVLLSWTCAAAVGQTPESAISLREALVLDIGTGPRRAPFSLNPVSEAMALGAWTAPKAGEKVAFPGAANTEWTPVKAGDDGWIASDALNHGYAYFVVNSDREEVRVLDASGHTMVFVNGEPRAGDPYEYGFVKLPVLLREGPNGFLFQCDRNGRMRAQLTVPRGDVTIETDDSTLPDLTDTSPVSTMAAVVVQNNIAAWWRDLTIASSLGGVETTATTIAALPPLTRKKVAVRIPMTAPIDSDTALTVKLRLQDGTILASHPFKLRERTGDETRTLTFVSAIDRSVQMCALTPGELDATGGRAKGLVLSLHGAGVDAGGQAACYVRKAGMHVVAPTNRRPFGFDWEDWGRLDALEVLDYARIMLRANPRRVWLTGHSMGGHGTWQLGALYPDRFAAIAPSAGWRSFFTYGGVKRGDAKDPIQEILGRAVNTSDTSLLTRNYGPLGVYILHGDADDNVPVAEARAMRDALAEFHRDVAYHEQPGAGHWWGNACLDWPPIFELFRRREIPWTQDVHEIDFTTVNPGVSASCHWIAIEQQVKAMAPSRVRGKADVKSKRIDVTTENVARVAIDARALALDSGVALTMDGQSLPGMLYTGKRVAHVSRVDGAWKRVGEPESREKNRRRSGPFKDAFRHHFLYVVGTAGTPAETAWAMSRARYDAETFWVRGNGSIDIILDKDFDASKELDRSVILLGNADTNGAWKSLLGESPIQLTRGSMRIGSKEIRGSQVGAHFLRPRPGSDTACVAVIGGTGLDGLRLTQRMPIYTSGVAYPDWCAVGPLTGEKGGFGFVGAGFFGNDWGIDSGESAFAVK